MWWSHWYGTPPARSSRIAIWIWPWPVGAAYYSYVRSTGSGVLVRGGLPRAYYIGLGEPRDGKFPPSAWCRAAPRKASTLEIDPDDLQLVANQPVSFRLYSSLTRTEDTLGAGASNSTPPMPTCTCTRRSTP